MSKTLTVVGDITTVDSRTLITGQGSVTAPSLVVPSWAKKIDRIIVTAGADGLAAGSAVFFLRLGGNAIQRGEQTVMISAGGVILPQAGSDQAPQYVLPIVIDNCDIDVSPSDTISIAAEMAGSDLGTARVAVTLVFA